MNINNKERLNQDTMRKYWLLRLANGCKEVVTDWRKAVTFIFYLISAVFICKFRGTLFPAQGGMPFDPLLQQIIQLLVIVYAIGGAILLLIALGTPFGSKRTRDNLLRIGLTNRAGEAPLLLSKKKDKSGKRLTVLEFMSNGIPLHEWENRKLEIQTALNVNVVRVTEGQDKLRVLLYVVAAKNAIPKMIYWKEEHLSTKDFELVLGEGLLGQEIVDLSKTTHVLLGGSTGSGKSVLLKSLTMQCLKKGAKVFISDFKGGIDFPWIWHKKCTIVTDETALIELLNSIVDEIELRTTILKKSGHANIVKYNQYAAEKLQRWVFVCDEVAEMLDKTGADKSRKDVISEIEAQLSTIARSGRAFGIHMILATQRPDANVLPGQIKSNFDCRICGRADNVLSMIILDNVSAAEQIPKDIQGRFITNMGTIFQGYIFDDNRTLNGVRDFQELV